MGDVVSPKRGRKKAIVFFFLTEHKVQQKMFVAADHLQYNLHCLIMLCHVDSVVYEIYLLSYLLPIHSKKHKWRSMNVQLARKTSCELVRYKPIISPMAHLLSQNGSTSQCLGTNVTLYVFLCPIKWRNIFCKILRIYILK